MVNTLQTSDHRSIISGPHSVHDDDDGAARSVERPNGWLYKSARIGKYSLGWFASPRTQLGMVALVCFLCPGTYNALNGLGGGGRKDATLADKMVSAKGIVDSQKLLG